MNTCLTCLVIPSSDYSISLISIFKFLFSFFSYYTKIINWELFSLSSSSSSEGCYVLIRSDIKVDIIFLSNVIFLLIDLKGFTSTLVFRETISNISFIFFSHFLWAFYSFCSSFYCFYILIFSPSSSFYSFFSSSLLFLNLLSIFEI